MSEINALARYHRSCDGGGLDGSDGVQACDSGVLVGFSGFIGPTGYVEDITHAFIGHDAESILVAGWPGLAMQLFRSQVRGGSGQGLRHRFGAGRDGMRCEHPLLTALISDVID